MVPTRRPIIWGDNGQRSLLSLISPNGWRSDTTVVLHNLSCVRSPHPQTPTVTLLQVISWGGLSLTPTAHACSMLLLDQHNYTLDTNKRFRLQRLTLRRISRDGTKKSCFFFWCDLKGQLVKGCVSVSPLSLNYSRFQVKADSMWLTKMKGWRQWWEWTLAVLHDRPKFSRRWRVRRRRGRIAMIIVYFAWIIVSLF